MKKQKLVVIIGPTAVGKTKLSINLAKKFNGEIISGDSAQIFKGMDIGTAKVTKDEMEGIPHYLIDCREPSESYNVYDFKQEVQQKINDITNRGKLPILVGGTGLYIQSVLYDYQFPETTANPNIREELEERIEQEGPDAVYQTLVEIDSVAAEKIHPNNTKRVIRALEVFYDSGKRFSEQEQSTERTLLYDVALIGLTMDRDLLYKRINERVEAMMQQGLEEEVRKLYAKGLKDAQSMQAIGYKEFEGLFEGTETRENVIAQIQRNSRRFAKRQFTWFRNKMDVHWFDMTNLADFEKISEEISLEVAGMLALKANR
ncbi:tRNA (adenosine(37)-N6)-dimethylallyltransferase MiaA [Pradoshia sp. D12]|uniref:tRNA (adenosine(37)-N6)-dimethylallyltransferase MiaA n=1 Tax=Bacillaceae TaxID=186817 RepID=UPI00112D223C|nr:MULTISPECIES: tRNA (adenosine(37)-N6)-dimethylallyltransferase MiaA [Bacillaceae]QFK71241.1 tRNA (adenosine(37)-N6)-dimethylallyltransferase MiaA [Pradoshia sp. D12]TPF73034.1 tRNA (adenosine(37)-N6)-dimethylallyltransferase MiaA [Bacillus sp. D12]